MLYTYSGLYVKSHNYLVKLYVLLVQDGLQIRIGTGTDNYAPFNTLTYWRQFLYQFNELVNVIVVGTSLQVSFNLEPQPDYIIKERRNQIWPFCTHLLGVNSTFVRCVIGKQPSGQNGAFFACDASCAGESMSGFVKYMYIHHKHHYSYSHSVFLCTKKVI